MNALIVIDIVLQVTDRILFRLNRKLQFLTFLVVILKAQKTQESILLVEVPDERHLHTQKFALLFTDEGLSDLYDRVIVPVALGKMLL